MSGLGGGTVRILLAAAVLLVAATAVRAVGVRRRPDRDTRDRWRSIGTWWLLFVVLVAMLILDRAGVVVTMAALSFLMLREGLELTDRARGSYPLFAGLALAVYLWAWLDWRGLFTRVLPSAIGLLVVAELVWRARLRPRLAGARAVGLAVLLAVIGPSFVVALASLPAPRDLPGTEMGWLVLLILLTEVNDIAQALWGRALGSRPMAPILSPAKTWEGFYGGLATTILAAALAGPMVTSYGRAAPTPGELQGPPWLLSVAAGLLIALSGIAGDLTASALKRSAGVKDSGTLLPGHGGLLDRLDSLALAAPAFFFLTYLLWMRQP